MEETVSHTPSKHPRTKLSYLLMQTNRSSSMSIPFNSKSTSNCMAQQNKTRLPKAVSVSEKGSQKQKNHPKSLRFSLESIPSPSSSSDNFSPDTFSPPTETYANTLSETHSKEKQPFSSHFYFLHEGGREKRRSCGNEIRLYRDGFWSNEMETDALLQPLRSGSPVTDTHCSTSLSFQQVHKLESNQNADQHA